MFLQFAYRPGNLEIFHKKPIINDANIRVKLNLKLLIKGLIKPTSMSSFLLVQVIEPIQEDLSEQYLLV